MPRAAQAGAICFMRNAAASCSNYSWLVFLDDDIVLAPSWFAELNHNQAAGDLVGTTLLNLDGTRYWDWASSGGPRGQTLLEYDELDPYLYLTGGNLIMNAAIWDAVRWDEQRGFRQGEDVVFCREAFSRGFKSSFCRRSVAIHNDPTYTQVGRQVVRRTDEGATLWLLNALGDLKPHELIDRSACELARGRVAEAVDCLRYATYKSPECAAGRILYAIESVNGGPIEAGQWRPRPII